MATAVQMPKLGNTVEECVLTTWLKHKGDVVAAGEVLAEVETDKATFEVTAPAAGVVLDTYFDEGAVVPVYTEICAIGAAGETADGVRPAGGTTPPSSPSRPVPGQPSRPVPGQPSRPAAESPAVSRPELSRARLSPRARRFAREHDFHPADPTGTGPGGRVLEADLQALFETQPRVSAAAAQALAAGCLPVAEGSGIGGMIRLGDLGPPAVQLSAVRQRIAARMRDSLSSTAQYTLNGSANAAGLLAVRRTLKADPATAAITINHLVAYCSIRALEQAPGLNAELSGGLLRQHAEIHLGFACDTDRGLMVPVIRDSQRLSLAALAGRMQDLAQQAALGTISPDDLTGGTFTITNLGSLGVESFTPVLNPPQVAILGINAIQLKPVRKADGNIEFIDSVGLSLTVDHQVIDGVPAARFLTVLAREIERAEELCTT